jgi:hypothetical protein
LAAKNKTVSAGGPAAAANGVTPAPLGDISKLPTDTNSVTTGGSNSTLPLSSSPTPPTSAPTGGGGAVDADHRKWHSIGDPHVQTGKENFDDTKTGDFTVLQSDDKSFEVQSRKEAFADGSVANTGVAVKDGDNVASYDVKSKKMMVNGKEWDGQTQPPGMKIEKTGDGYSITSSKGDVTNVHDKGHYVDIDGEIGPNRQVGEVKGAYGAFDNTDGAESHIKKDGTAAANTDEMIDSWKVGQGESLFDKAGVPAAGGPAAAGTGGANPVAPDAPKDGAAPADPNAGKGGPAPADANGPKPADPNAPKDGAAPADGKGGPAISDDIKTALQDILKQLKDLIASLEKVMQKLGVDAGAKPAGETPAAGGPAAAPAPADAKPADAKPDGAAAAADGKGGPAAAPATFEDQKKADAAGAADKKTFAEQKKEDEAKAAAAATDGKGGPAAAAAAAPAADAKPADAKAAAVDAKPVEAGGPAGAADPLKEILTQLQDLIKQLQGLLEKLQGVAGGAAPAAPAAPAAAAAPVDVAKPAEAKAA